VGLFTPEDTMQFTQKVDSISRQKDKTLATATAYKLFSDASGEAPNMRQAVVIVNTDATADLWIRICNKGEAPGTISATVNDGFILAKGRDSFSCGPAFDIWVQHAKGSDATFTYKEYI
jgi:hypothetical protein